MQRPSRASIASLASIALIGLAGTALAGCASGDAGEVDTADGLQVVATTTQLGDFTREVAGEDAEVTQLLQPGQSAHSFDPTPSALQALGAADVLIVNGAGLEEWLDSAVDASGFDGVLVDTSLHAHLHGGEGHDHDDEGEDAAGDDHADEVGASGDEQAEEGDDHDHDGVDPHIWSDPHNAEHMVEAIVDALAEAEPDAADGFESRGDAYLAKLAALDTWMHASVDPVPEAERLLVTNHDTFSYLAESLGITVVGSVMNSFDDNAEPSAQEIDDLVAQIRATGVRAVFSETSIDPTLARTIAEEAGVTVYSGEDSLYADSLGAEGTPGATYIGSQIHNLTMILESWGATPAPLPAELETS